jgi:phage-related protein (TIGR01555 family)
MIHGAAAKVRQFDAWTNAITALGVAGKDAQTATAFEREREISREQLMALYEQEWLFARCIDAVPEYGTQKWIRVGARSETGSIVRPKWSTAILDKLEKLKARERFEHAWKMDRLEGGSYIVIGTNNSTDSLEAPLTPESVKTVDFLNVISRYDVNPYSTQIERNPTKPNFLMPEIYTLAGTAQKIHSSRIIRFDGLKKPSTAAEFNEYGISISSRIFDAVRKFGDAFGYFSGSFRKMVMGILQMKGLANMMAADEESEALLMKRLSAMALAASAFNMTLLDEDEVYQNASIDFTGAGAAILRVMDLVAGAAETPLSILFGQAPTGLSTDDESGRRAFYSMVARQQGSKLRAPLRWLVELIMNSDDVTLGGDTGDLSWFLEFVPLDEPTSKERAEIERNEAETDSIRVREGILTEIEARSRIAKDPQSPYDLDEGFEPQPTPGLEDPELEPADDPNIESGDKPGVGEDVQSKIPNGEQMKQQREIIGDVAAGRISRESGIAFLVFNFGMDGKTAAAMLGPEGFEPRKPEPSPMPGQQPGAQVPPPKPKPAE